MTEEPPLSMEMAVANAICAAIERVTAEQVDEPRPIEDWLAAAPLPSGDDEESDGEMIAAVGQATVAHAEALVEIARDFDQLRRDWPTRTESSGR
jgi:hypothetical protein